MLVRQPLCCFMKSYAKEEKFDILYEDNHLLIVNKPANLLTQKADCCNHSLESLVVGYLQKKMKKITPFCYPLHRLDKPVSGIVVFAKSSKMLKRFYELQRKREVIKKYCAIVEGVIPEKKKILIHYLIHASHRAQVVSKSYPNAKEAILEMEVEKRKKNKSFIILTLKTGRYHQIRSQLAAIGHPILGDKKYHSLYESDRIDLHHFFLSFCHPVKRERIEIHSPSPFSL
jgi:23S rRNA pseudouridine1911/1915/1917 synthase